MENKTDIVELANGQIGDCSVEIIDYVQVINYSKGKSLNIRFNYLGEPTEENPEGSFKDGGHTQFKFKDPRDALNYLVRNYELLGSVELKILFDYVQFHETDGKYSQMEIYYLLILEIKIPLILEFVLSNHIPKNDFKEYTPEELEIHKASYSKFYKEYENSIREAHKFAVANTWKVWNDIQYVIKRNEVDTSEFVPTLEDIKRSTISINNVFDKTYKDKRVSIVFGFNLYRRLWKVIFEDNSWVIASDQSNGWYHAETDLNSYKLLER